MKIQFFFAMVHNHMIVSDLHGAILKSQYILHIAIMSSYKQILAPRLCQLLGPSRISRIQMLKLQSIGHIILIIVLKVLKAYRKHLILLDVKLLAYDKISNHGNVISLVRLHVHDTLCSYTEYCNMTHRPFCNSRQLLWTVQHALPTCAPYTRSGNVKWVCST